MTSIDDLFKKPALPSNKRKLEVAKDPNEAYKSAKLGRNGQANGKNHATVDDEEDIEAGPEAPPDDEDYGPDIPDDEEGRFFGGGITKDESEILDYMDGQEGADVAPEKIDVAWVRKLALNFEKRISKNAELRAKFENEPQKFMVSEADLDADVKALSILSEHSELYTEFARLGCVNSLVSLLAHENTDISIDAIEIISELTDEDVEAEAEQWNALVDAMIDADLLDLLVSNFSRFDETNESDRSGVYFALSVLENLSSRTSLAEKIGKDTSVLKWLLQRAQKRESPVSQNKQYAAEVLAILLQSSPVNRQLTAELDGLDILLQLLAAYRKRDPVKGTDEEEFVENIFDCVTCIVDEVTGKQKFLEAEGVELCLIMLREGKMSKPRALRLLDHALGSSAGSSSSPSSSSFAAASAVCEKLIDAAGLKVLFSMFMKKPDTHVPAAANTTEHLLGIFASLLRLLPADSAGRIRTLAKFVERDYEKLARLVRLRRDYAARVAVVDQEKLRTEEQLRRGRRLDDGVEREEEEERADEWLSRRLDAGLFCLQTADVVLAWLVAEDGGAAGKVRALMAEGGEGLGVIGATIREQLNSMADAETEEEQITRDMLEALIQFVT